MKKRLILTAAIALIVITILLLIKSGPLFKTNSEVTLTTVKKEDLVKKISASGKIKANQEVELRFQTSGRLAWVGVKEGDLVKKWQAIASLDTRELERDFQKALRDYSKERWDFEQEREDQNVTTDNLDQHTLTNEVRRILEKNQFDLEKAIMDVEIKEIALKYATLITPISGIVTEIDSPIAGVNITPARASFTIANPNSVYFSADIDEVDISGIRTGQSAVIVLDSFPEEEFESQVSQVGFNAKTTSGGGTAFEVKFPLPENLNQKFKLGMNGDVEIFLRKKTDVLTVPIAAIMEREEKTYVWLVEKGRAKKTEVEIGALSDQKAEITKGLKEGDKIIAKGISKIKEGEKIR